MTNAKRMQLLKVSTMFYCMLWFSFTLPASAAMSSNETDRLALMAFKDSITQDPGGVLSSWDDALHFCSWNGVSCGNKHQERVTRLDLLSKNLSGTLSPFIGNLSFLRRLNLSGNFLHGEIPPQINRLFRLEYLLATNNSFEGMLPTNLSNLSNLRHVRLANNKLSGEIPNGISYLQKLESLDLGGNNLVGSIPPSLGNLSFLTNLNIPNNHLEGSIPNELAQLQKLRFFTIDLNNVKGIIPRQLYNLSTLNAIAMTNNDLEGSLPWDIGLTLPNLQWLGLGGNKLSGSIPVSLPNCSQLYHIDLSDNQISGTVPQDLGRLQNLYRLSLGDNKLGSNNGNDLSFLSSLVNCSSLQVIAAANNSLKGFLPESIGNLSSELLVFTVGRNQIYGEIPSGIGNLNNLNYFDIQFNHITGVIPDAVGKLRNLQQITMDRNKLSGRIPSSFGNLTVLNNLILGHNNIHGSLPPSLGNCQRLLQLDISYCNLTGEVPSQLFERSTQITTLQLNHNAFTGHLPLQVGNLKSLAELDISDNKLSGGIPDTLGGCVSLVHLYIQRNLFEGTIPQSLNALRGLEVFDVSNNNLTGRIPQFLEKLPVLSNLNLSFNDFEGTVPEKGVFRNASLITVDGNSKLCGGIAAVRLPRCFGLSSKTKRDGKTSSLILKAIFPAIVGVMILAALAYFVVIPRTKRLSRKQPSFTSSFDDKLQRVSYGELFKATNNFSEDRLIGVGSFGSVYKGILDQEVKPVAVKVLNLQQKGGSKSFMSECNALKNIRHRNLVRIMTSCSAVDFRGNDFKALVFEFMPNGSLERWLYPEEIHEQGELRDLNLVQRLNVVIDVASALEYLHHNCGSTIVHSDLKPSNVLLDNEMIARLGDFGLAKVLSSVSDNSGQDGASSFVIKGSIGYVPPEYGMSGEVTIEGDVYSYGILLLEIFIAKKPTNEMFKDGLSLHSYVKMSLPEKVIEIVDSRLTREDIDPLTQECLVSILSLGVACSMEYPRERMHIKDVVKKLSLIKDNYQNGDATSKL